MEKKRRTDGNVQHKHYPLTWLCSCFPFCRSFSHSFLFPHIDPKRTDWSLRLCIWCLKCLHEQIWNPSISTHHNVILLFKERKGHETKLDFEEFFFFPQVIVIPHLTPYTEAHLPFALVIAPTFQKSNVLPVSVCLSSLGMTLDTGFYISALYTSPVMFSA